jgi:hypothetical protein
MSVEKFLEIQPEIPSIVYETAEQAILAFIQLTQTGILKPENFQLEGQSVLHQTILDNFSPDKFRGKIHTVDTTGFSQYQYDLDTMPLEIPVENYIEASGIWFLRLNKENLTPNMIGIAAMGYKPALLEDF